MVDMLNINFELYFLAYSVSLINKLPISVNSVDINMFKMREMCRFCV